MKLKYTAGILCTLLGTHLAVEACTVAGNPETAAQQHAEQPADSASREIRFIERFYADYVFGKHGDAHEAVGRSCTKELRERLRAVYAAEYDGEGYAIWLFRSGAQDGPGDESRVKSVSRLAEGLYRVEFLDMGIEGTRTLKLATHDGMPLFDEIGE